MAEGEVVPPVVEPDVAPEVIPVEEAVLLLGVVDGIQDVSRNNKTRKYLKSMVIFNLYFDCHVEGKIP